MRALVVAEHDDKHLSTATLNSVTAGKQLCDNLSVLVAGYDCRAVVDAAASINSIDRVYHAEAEHYAHGLAEELAPLVVSLAEGMGFILAPATTFGKDLLPRVAAMLNVNQISDVVKIESGDTFVRPIYAGNATATVRTTEPVKVMTIRTTVFETAAMGEGAAPIETIEPLEPRGLSAFISAERSDTEQPALTTARIVVAGGRGVGGAENFQLINELAERLNAAVGATRAAVDAGYVSNDYQVGQTGKVIAPDLYIAVGISGAIQHLAGIKDSKVIVAINEDPDAPVFEVADYGLVADLFQALPELLQALDN